MTPSLVALLVGAGCTGAHVLLTLLLLRLPGRLSPVGRHAASALLTHVVGVVGAGFLLGPLPYWPAAAASGFGAVVWLFAFSAVYKSVSLKVLTQLARTPGGDLPFNVLTTDYVQAEFVARTEVLTAMGWVQPTPGGFTLTPAGKAAARRLRAIQRVCGIERSGLYGTPDTTGRREAA